MVVEAYCEEKSVEVALAKVCSPVQAFALVRLRPMVLAVPPLYVPENERVESVAERLARLEPRAIPEMVEFCSWLLPIVVVETTWPLALVERRVFTRPERAKPLVTARLVAVALVIKVVARVVEPVKVEEAVEIKPFWNWMVVEVAF